MPVRDHDRGTLIIDRRIPGVGRLKRASGTNDRTTYKRLLGMLDTLQARGRLDLLRGLKQKVVTPLELWDAFRREDLDTLPSAETVAPVWTADGAGAAEKWLAAWTKSPDHKRATASSFAQLRKLAGDDDNATARVGELPTLLARYRVVCAKAGHATSFNRARSHVQAFLRDTLGRSHRLWKECGDLQPLPVASKKKGGKRKGAGGLPVAAFVKLCEKLAAQADGRYLTGADYVACALGMAGAGMGPKEYWGEWDDCGTHVDVWGTKRQQRERQVPRLWPIPRPTMHPRTFADAVAAVSSGAVVAYDLRRTFSHWMEEAKIVRARRRIYMGHGARDVTDLYESHEVEAYLAKDGEAIREYVRLHWPKDAAVLCPVQEVG